MNLIFLRHGESIDNVKELLSDKEIYWSILTKEGKKQVIDSVNNLQKDIDVMYVSPLPRTIETAHYVYEKYPYINVVIENRIREINYGKYSGSKNNKELDEVRNKQINGDYLVRFGEFGENKLEIEKRLSSFLADLSKENYKNVLIVSHGSVISHMKRLLNIKTNHIKKGQFEIFENIDLKVYIKKNTKIKI